MAGCECDDRPAMNGERRVWKELTRESLNWWCSAGNNKCKLVLTAENGKKTGKINENCKLNDTSSISMVRMLIT